MKVLIAGCGRVGSQLAIALSSRGHDVAIMDKNPASFRRLGDGFTGQIHEGIVFDRPLLERAGIRQAQAFVAVTSGDNSNIVSARAAKLHFQVPDVVARIYDPERAVIYERLGITTIATARWTAEQVLGVLLPDEDRIESVVGPGAGDVVLIARTLPAGVKAVPASQLHRPGEVVLVAVTREGVTRVPPANAVLHSGDHVHLAVQREATDRVAALIAGLVTDH